MTTLTHQSPFDAIRRVELDGSEYWTARDMQPLMAYVRFEDFQRIVQRAMESAKNAGQEGFSVVTEIPAGGGRPRTDYKLSRFAAYLVAMNGDPSKREVAEAQAYFAIQTRVAETQSASGSFDLTTLDGISQILDAGKAALNRAVAAEARAEKSETRLDIIEGGKGFSLRQFHKHHFPDVPERQFFELLYRRKLLIDQRGARGRDANGKLRDGKQHRHPAAAGKPYFFLDPWISREGERYYSTKVRPGRPESDLVELLAKWGLAPNQHRLLEITA